MPLPGAWILLHSGCALEAEQRPTVPEEIRVEGTLPVDYDLFDARTRLQPGEVELVGHPGRREVAVVQRVGGERAATFVADGPALCIDCVGLPCGGGIPSSLVRTVQIPLTVTTTGPADQVAYGPQTVTADNFLPFASDFGGSSTWTPSTSPESVNAEISGTVPVCAPFVYRFQLTTDIRTVFVSEAVTSGDLGPSPLSSADALCQGEADTAGLQGTFAAWLSTGPADAPASRFDRSTGPYVLPDGTLVARDWDDLVDGSLSVPIDTTAAGDSIFDSVTNPDGYTWTGTEADGTAAIATCSGWSSASSGLLGASGASDRTTPVWSHEIDDSCNAAYSLVCVQQ